MTSGGRALNDGSLELSWLMWRGKKESLKLMHNEYANSRVTTSSLTSMTVDARMGNSHELLNSWKEIARHLDRGVRTVQRWERDLQLPVHRIGKGKRSPVYAVVSELKFWMITSAGKRAMLTDGGVKPRGQSSPRDRERLLAARLHNLAQGVAEASARHQRQAEALEKNILALRSRVSLRKSK